jgi:hypothetical protein
MVVEFGVDLVGIELTQCSGSMTIWYGSGSADLKHWIPDPDPAPFISGVQDAYYYQRCTTVFKDSKLLRSHKTLLRNQVFLKIFAC